MYKYYLLILIIGSISLDLVASPAQAQPQNNDYFAPERDPKLLRNVEKYHLTKEKFGKYYQAGQYSSAIRELQFVLRYFPNHPKALMYMETIAKITNNQSLALSHYKNALKLYPQHALTHAQYGRYLASTGRVQSGIERLQKATEMDPELAVAHGWLAMIYAKSGSTDLARQTARQARKLGYRGRIN